jgi:hypothetical protein
MNIASFKCGIDVLLDIPWNVSQRPLYPESFTTANEARSANDHEVVREDWAVGTIDGQQE